MKSKWQNYLVLTLCIVVVLYAVTWAFRSCVRTVVDTPRTVISGVSEEAAKTLQNVADVFARTLNVRPEIRIEEKTIHAQSAPLAEFAVIEQDFTDHYEWRHKWLGSEKTIVIEGVFHAKAGFDLHQPFIIKMDSQGVITAELPPAKILSVEQQGQLTFQDQDGFWNKVSSADRQGAINEFMQSAKQKAINSDLCKKAEQEAQSRIQELMQRNGKPLVLKFKTKD